MPDYLKILLDKAKEAGKDASSLQEGARSAAGRCFPRCAPSTRQRGIDTYQTYATADLGIIAYESAALRGHDRRRGRDRGDRAAGHRRSRAGGRGRRGGGHHLQPRLSDDPLRHRRPVGGAAGARARAGAPTCASRAGSAAPTRPPRSRACSCIPSRWPRWPSAIPSLGRVRLVVERAMASRTS